MLSHRASLRWSGASTFRRTKKDRDLMSRWTGLDSTREFVGATCDYMRRYPAVCQVGAAKVET